MREHDEDRRERERYRVLVGSQLLTDEQLDEAVREGRRTGSGTAAALMALGHIAKGAIGYALYAHYQRPFLDGNGIEPCRPLTEAIGVETLRAGCWLPLREVGDIVHVWTDDPSSPETVASIRAALPGRELRLYVGLREEVLRAVDALGAGGGDRRRLAGGLGALALLLLLPAAALAAPSGSGTSEKPKTAPNAAPTPPPAVFRPLDAETKRCQMVANAAEIPLEFVQAMREMGLDWDHITRDLLVTLGPDRRPWRGAMLSPRLNEVSGGAAARMGAGGPGTFGTTGSGGCHRCE